MKLSTRLCNECNTQHNLTQYNSLDESNFKYTNVVFSTIILLIVIKCSSQK